MGTPALVLLCIAWSVMTFLRSSSRSSLLVEHDPRFRGGRPFPKTGFHPGSSPGQVFSGSGSKGPRFPGFGNVASIICEKVDHRPQLGGYGVRAASRTVRSNLTGPALELAQDQVTQEHHAGIAVV